MKNGVSTSENFGSTRRLERQAAQRLQRHVHRLAQLEPRSNGGCPRSSAAIGRSCAASALGVGEAATCSVSTVGCGARAAGHDRLERQPPVVEAPRPEEQDDDDRTPRARCGAAASQSASITPRCRATWIEPDRSGNSTANDRHDQNAGRAPRTAATFVTRSSRCSAATDTCRASRSRRRPTRESARRHDAARGPARRPHQRTGSGFSA